MQAVDNWDCSVGGGLNGHIFNEIISIDNLFAAWREFCRGKRQKPDVQEFEFELEDNLFTLRQELSTKVYRVQPYTSFYITDPKLRHIHKASVRDLVLFQAVFRVLSPILEKSFIYDSFASRIGKGTHSAVDRLEKFLIKTSSNNRQGAWALKCDIRKFFDSIDHEILFALIVKKISDPDCLWLIRKIIRSFSLPVTASTQCSPELDCHGVPRNDKTKAEMHTGKGLPLGNVTSQLFANLYLHQLDFYIKQRLRNLYYLRYCDDFIVVDTGRAPFQELIEALRDFLADHLALTLHPRKIEIRSYHQGIDFLGYVVRPHHRLLRTKTKQQLLRLVQEKNLPSYLGVLSHCNGYKIQQSIFNAL